jgi:hypothetical protein
MLSIVIGAASLKGFPSVTRMRLRALITAAQSIERFLCRIGEPTEPPTLSPARGPPFFESRVVRRRFGDADDDAPPR